jgi:hypothetical protein
MVNQKWMVSRAKLQFCIFPFLLSCLMVVISDDNKWLIFMAAVKVDDGFLPLNGTY